MAQDCAGFGGECLLATTTNMYRMGPSDLPGLSVGSWANSPNHGEFVRVLEVETV